MKNVWLALTLCLAIPAVLAVAQGVAAEPVGCFVATDGNDAWSGKLAEPNAEKTDGPLATLARARDEIRKQKAAGAAGRGFTVSVRAGVYCLDKTFTLTAEDAGTADAPIRYQAYPGETPILVGGRRVTGFTRHQGEILKADVGAQGFRGVYFRQLLFDGRRQHLARFPNYDPENPYAGGWSYVDGKPIPMYAQIPGEDRRTLVVRPDDLHDWARVTEGEVLVFPRYNWWNNVLRIGSLDRDTRVMKLAGDASYFIRPGDRYFVRNLFEELDAPGEWYLDRDTWTLYFWPPSPIDEAAVYAPTLQTVVKMAGASHVTLRGFTIECCEGTAVEIVDSTDCRIVGSTVRNVGGRCTSGIAAVSVSGGRRVGVVGCDVYQVGSHAIRLSGGDRKTLTPGDHYAENNYIHHTGVFYKQGVGVQLGGVGNRASHNLIHDCPRFGVLYGGNDQVIEWNHIRHVDLETADTGATYSGGRDWLSPRGTVIRYNYIHDVFGFGKHEGRWTTPHYCWGIYLDDNSAEVHVVGNVVVRALRGLLHFHCARDNLVENNIFVDGQLQQIEMNGWNDYSKFLDQDGAGVRSAHQPARLEEVSRFAARRTSQGGGADGWKPHPAEHRLLPQPGRDALQAPPVAVRPFRVRPEPGLPLRPPAPGESPRRAAGKAVDRMAETRLRPRFARGRPALRRSGQRRLPAQARLAGAQARLRADPDGEDRAVRVAGPGKLADRRGAGRPRSGLRSGDAGAPGAVESGLRTTRIGHS